MTGTHARTASALKSHCLRVSFMETRDATPLGQPCHDRRVSAPRRRLRRAPLLLFGAGQSSTARLWHRSRLVPESAPTMAATAGHPSLSSRQSKLAGVSPRSFAPRVPRTFSPTCAVVAQIFLRHCINSRYAAVNGWYYPCLDSRQGMASTCGLLSVNADTYCGLQLAVSVVLR